MRLRTALDATGKASALVHVGADPAAASAVTVAAGAAPVLAGAALAKAGSNMAGVGAVVENACEGKLWEGAGLPYVCFPRECAIQKSGSLFTPFC